MKRAAVTIPFLLLALAGCAAGPTPTSDPTGPDIQPTPLPSQVVSPTEPALAGDCTATDGVVPGLPVIYTVYVGPDSNPVTVNYTAFNLDGTNPIVTETITGPVWSKVGYACTDAASSTVWTLTVTQATPDPVGCVLAFGGKLVATDSQAEGAVSTTAQCYGNPGM
jgi:hypothetical protein